MNEEGDVLPEMHSGYFKTHFRVHEESARWPEEFVIVSAYATTGETWTTEKNEGADAELRESLRRRHVWHRRIVGFSTETDHAEPSWAAELPLEEARALGQRFRQDAIFHVRGDRLSVTRCGSGAPLVGVGGFRDRVQSAEES